MNGRAGGKGLSVVRTGIAAASDVASIGKIFHHRALIRAVFSSRSLSLLDQAVVSGTSLFVTVTIGRATVPSQLGVYALIMSLIIALQNAQNALIASPYTIQRHRPTGTPAEHAGSALALCALLAVVATIVMVLVASIIDIRHENPVLETAVWVLAATAPFILIREFGRGYAFAHLQIVKVLLLDLGVAAVQISAIGYLAWTGSLSTASALVAIGTAYGLTGLAWLYGDRRQFLVCAKRIPDALRQSWRLGRWILANQISLVAQVNLGYWLVAVMAGTAETGIYAACMSVASLANPLVLGLSNMMFAQATVAFKEGGYTKLRRDAIYEVALLGAGMAAFCAVILFAGEQVLHLLFARSDYIGHGDILVALALWQLAHAIGIPASNALAAMERVRINFYTGLAGTSIAAVLIALLVSGWGLIGAAIGLLIGSAARSAMRWAVFLTISKESAPALSCSSNADAARRVLQQLANGDGHRRPDIAQLDVGSQGHIFATQSPEHGLVIKLFKRDNADNWAAALAQRRRLLALYDAIHGLTVHGWTIQVPKPLYVTRWPVALVMTRVSGRKLDVCLEDGVQLNSEALDSAPRAIAAAMQRCWSVRMLHGDLAFHNILCDAKTRELSFIDAGAVPDCCKRGEIDRNWSPAVHDLAHVLCDVCSDTKHMRANRTAYMRSRRFGVDILWTWIDSIGSATEKQKALDELLDCSRSHIDAIGSSRFPHGIWHAARRWIARRRVGAMLAQMQADITGSLDRQAESERATSYECELVDTRQCVRSERQAQSRGRT